MHIYVQTHPCTYIFPPCIFNSVWFVCYVHVCLCMCVGTLVPVGTHAGQRFLPVRLPFFNLLLETSSLIWVDWLISEPLGLVCSLQCFGITVGVYLGAGESKLQSTCLHYRHVYSLSLPFAPLKFNLHSLAFP